jgi:HEAT repeats
MKREDRRSALGPASVALCAALVATLSGAAWARQDAAPPAAAEAASAPAPSDKAGPDDEEKLIADMQAKWSRQIRAIRSNKLESSVESLVADGARRILEIKDPLAVLPLARGLGDGNIACRRTLIDALARFPQDEATLNLAVIALSDRQVELRRKAIAVLLPRNDPRVVPQFRKALQSDNDFLIRNAADALGRMKAAPAVPELINVLKARRRKSVDIPVQNYFGALPTAFANPTDADINPQRRVRHVPRIGIAAAGNFAGISNERRMQDVTVFRTEVLDALVAITGVNHGFDEAAWRRWYQEQTR